MCPEPILEICVQGVEAAVAAQAGGAHRLELCENLDVGGVTPSWGAIAVARRHLAIPIALLIRPRGGDFRYSEAEFEAMQADIDAAGRIGVDAVVLGVLAPDRTIDRERTARLVEAARPLEVVFHKAFDEVLDPLKALEILIELGVDRILTSGQAATARAGMHRLDQLREAAGGRIAIMPGGGVDAGDIARLRARGFRQIHVGSAARVGGRTDAGAVAHLVEVVGSE